MKFGINAFGVFFFLFMIADADIGIQTPKPFETTLDPRRGLVSNLSSLSQGFINPDRFSIQHTLGTSFRSGVQGGLNHFYLNKISYKFSRPITVLAQFGIQTNPYGTANYKSSRDATTQFLIPYLGLSYKPKPNVHIEFSFRNFQSYHYPGNHLY